MFTTRLFVVIFLSAKLCLAYDYSQNDIEEDNLQKGIFDWFKLIFPGTKWCGHGDVAENDDDLGTERDTDKCCRAHDKCPDIIGAHGEKYNLTNPKFYTRLSCDCDDQFYKCLKSVNSKTSNRIGKIYFTGLSTQCFKEDYPIVGCEKRSYLPRIKCLEYEFDCSGPRKYQWFDLPNF